MSLSVGRQTLRRSLLRQLRPSRLRQFSTSYCRLQAEPVEPAPNQLRIRKHVESPSHLKRAPQTSDINGGAVIVELDGQKHLLSTILLRDLCTCPQCIDTSTKQKHFSTADIPADIRGYLASEDTGDITLTWQNDIPNYGEDHTTQISRDQLRDLLGLGTTARTQEPIPRSLWDSRIYETETSDFSYEQYMQDDSVLLKALRQLHTHGLLFVTNVPEDEKSVENVAERIGPLKTTFYGRTWDVRSVPDAINVAYTAQNLGFHMDLMYMEQPPHLQLLHCIRSSAAGGASLFTDSFRAASDLFEEDSEAFQTLSLLRANFHYDHPGSHYYHQCRPVIQQKMVRMGNLKAATYRQAEEWKQEGRNKYLPAIHPIDSLDSVAWAPPFQAPFGLRIPDSTAVGTGRVLSQSVNQWHEAAAKFNHLIHRPEMIYERMMKPGELVIFDNRRVLHARKAFEVGDVGKERWLRGAYIDKDPYMSKLRVLRETLENQPVEEILGENYFEAISSPRRDYGATAAA